MDSDMHPRALAASFSALAALATCQTIDRGAGTPPRAFVTSVLASAEMSPYCRGATMIAVSQLARQGADLTLLLVPEDHPAIALEPRLGEVAVHAALPAELGALAETIAWRSPTGTVLRAEVRLGDCSVTTIVHELAHVIGLERRVDYEVVFHRSRLPWGRLPSERQAP